MENKSIIKLNKNMQINKRKCLLAARIISILFICFISLFALDIFDMQLGLVGTILGVFMHLIPSIIMGVLVYFSWKNPKIGFYGFGILALVFTLYFRTYTFWGSFLTISLPTIILAGLYYLAKE